MPKDIIFISISQLIKKEGGALMKLVVWAYIVSKYYILAEKPELQNELFSSPVANLSNTSLLPSPKSCHQSLSVY